ncbi:MAG: asparagine synthase C-terminal domain-containing protein [Polyangiaceae bacterium]
MILVLLGSSQGPREREWKRVLSEAGLAEPTSLRVSGGAHVAVWGPQHLVPKEGGNGLSVRERGVTGAAIELLEEERGTTLRACSPSIEGRPTYVRVLPEGLRLLSTDLATLAAVGPKPAIDASGLAGQTVYVGARHRLPFRDIERIPALEEWVFDAAGAVRKVASEASKAEVRTVQTGPRELAEAFWDLTRRAVRRAIDGRTRVAVMAAGGLDSSALLAATIAEARGANPKEVSTITWHFGGRGDDRPYFADLVRELGIVPVYLAPTVAANDVLSAMVARGLPLTPLTVTLQTCAIRAAKEQGAEVLLLGSGGDEVLAGVVESAITGDALYRPRGLARALGRAMRYRAPVDMPFSRRLGLIGRPLLRPFLPASIRLPRMKRALGRYMPHLGPRSIELLDDAARQRVRDIIPRTPTERFRAFAGRPMFEEYAEHRSQIEGFAGLPIRDPYFDEEVARFVAAIPPPLLLHGDLHRGLFREALRGKVPERIRVRSDKASFEELVHALMAPAETRARALELSRGRRSEALGIVDGTLLHREVREALGGSMDDGYVRMSFLWSALVVEAFLEVAE